MKWKKKKKKKKGANSFLLGVYNIVYTYIL